MSANTVFMPSTPAIVSKAAGFGFTMAIVVGDAVAQRAGQLVGGPAVFRIGVFVFGFDINKVFASLSQGVEHPHYVVAVFFNGVGEVKTATAPLGTGYDKQVRKALAVQA